MVACKTREESILMLTQNMGFLIKCNLYRRICDIPDIRSDCLCSRNLSGIPTYNIVASSQSVAARGRFVRYEVFTAVTMKNGVFAAYVGC
jgi:hypothetical protein